MNEDSANGKEWVDKNYINEIKKTEKEYRLLFDKVPCYVILIDRDFKIVRANQRITDLLGALKGEHCFSRLKGESARCSECTARQTFEDGKMHSGQHVWTLKDGRTLNMHVVTVLVTQEDREDDLVMEMAVDISKTIKLQERVENAHNYLESLINTSMDGIVGINSRGRVTVFNSAARKMFDIDPGQVVFQEDLNSMLPNGFLARVSQGGEHVYLPESQLKTSKGETFWARLIGNRLEDIEQTIGMAFSVQDLSQVKKLEEEKIEAERMAIVGQTVAGLSHGIKNLVNALDGGMYYLKSGIGKGDIDRVQKGIETLARNIERIRIFSKSFLNFSSTKNLSPALCDPVSIAKEVLESYLIKARNNGIELRLDAENKIEPVSLDYEKMHECLTNLVGNAIDACIEMEEKKSKSVIIRVYEEERTVFYEIIDTGTGIDKETQGKIFNKFFTTKGLEGTGLGLLMAKKIIQEHGGQIDLFSKKGEGTTFRIRLIRRFLPKILNDP